jgi:hypothetical protein
MKAARKRARSGLTLLELLMAIGLAVIMTAALSYAFAAGLSVQHKYAERQADPNHIEAMRQRITKLLRSARLYSATDTTTYFVAYNNGNGGDLGADQIVFTTTAVGVPLSAMTDDDDFQTQQNANGPVGGTCEVSYSMVPVGDAGGRTGLFERIQHPSDGDPTQGGMESLLAPEITRIGFQFWDGLEWTTTWDTTQTGAGTHHLPAAVKVSYTVQGQSDSNAKAFIVPLLTSDVTDQNPVTAFGGNP